MYAFAKLPIDPPIAPRRSGVGAILSIAILCLFSLALPLRAQTSGDSPITHRASVPSVRTPLEVVNGTATFVAHYESESKLRLTIGLSVPKAAEEEAFLRQLQDRDSPNFHKYLSAEEWNARFAPAAEDEQAVADWLANAGFTVTRRYANRLIVNVEAPVRVIESAFGVRINRYRLGGNLEFSNDRDPVIPAHLAAVMHSVAGMNSIQRLHPARGGDFRLDAPDYSPGPVAQERETRRGDSDPHALEAAMAATNARIAAGTGATLAGPEPEFTDGLLDPADLYSSQGYDFQALNAQGHCCNPTGAANGSTPITSLAVATAGDFSDADFDGFQAQFGYLSYNYTREWVNGTPTCCGDETTLDTEWSIATSNSLTNSNQTAHVYIYEAPSGTTADFITEFNTMLSDNHARVMTMSWGCAEITCWTAGDMDTAHNTFNQMVGQGWTLLSATGDNGSTPTCGAAVQVIYPSSDWDIVAVGGTLLQFYGNNTFSSETAWQGNPNQYKCAQNQGGTGGGCSEYFKAPGYQSNPYCGPAGRSVPDIALNAAGGQTYYFQGKMQGVGGTSIATPEVAGFMAQENSYLMSIGKGCGNNDASDCAPMGQAHQAFYKQGYANMAGQLYAPHNPFYDITTGCNSNYYTILYDLGTYCAGPGYDAVTGWGSFNALQLAWSLNWYIAADYGAPTVSFSGPSVSPSSDTWFNGNQQINWTVADTGEKGHPAIGVAGFSWGWDTEFSDPTSEPHQGTGNSFYSGPQFPNQTGGFAMLAGAGQGCHTLTVDAWDNTGYSAGNQSFGKICYDSVAPTLSASSAPAPNASGWNNTQVLTTLTATDPGAKASGIANTYFSYGNNNCAPAALASCHIYVGVPLDFSNDGVQTYLAFTQDNANNFSTPFVGFVKVDKTAPVTKAILSGNIASGGSFGTYDSAVTITLSATDNLSGVEFTSYRLDGAGIASYSKPIAVSASGTHGITFYSTDVAGNTEEEKTQSFTIDLASTTTLAVSPNPAINGQTITLAATVLAGSAPVNGGTVNFLSGSTLLGKATVVNGKASVALTSLALGDNSITASYTGGQNVLASTSNAVVEDFREGTATTLTTSPNPSVAGQPVTFTATVGQKQISRVHVTGWVQFYAGSTALAFVQLVNGVATCTVSTLPVGTNPISAQYAGDVDYAPSSSFPRTQTVEQGTSTTLLISSRNPAQFLQTIQLAATVTSAYGTPAGTVSFESNGLVLGIGTLSRGIATFSSSALPVGTESITAVYKGTTSYAASTSAALAEQVTPAESQVLLSSALNPAHYGQSIALPVTVSNPNGGLPSGALTLMSGTAVVGNGNLVNGSGTLYLYGPEFSYPVSGQYSLTAVYAGNADFLGATSPVLIETVNPATTATTLTSSLNPSNVLSRVTFTATVKAGSGPAPGGEVTFMEGRSVLGSGALSSSGVATFTAGEMTAGTHVITAYYVGSPNDLSSDSAAYSQVVKPLL